VSSLPTKQELIDANGPTWSSALGMHGFATILVVLEVALIWALAENAPWWLIVAIMVPIIHLMHTQLLILHEAVHFNFAPNRFWNESVGITVGLFSFTSLSLYRAIHHPHHSYQSTERDEELWPFVDPLQPRWKRWLCAFLELTFGLIYTPSLFLRAFVRRGSHITEPRVRRRIWLELGVIAVFWAVVLAIVVVMGWWWYLLMAFVVPAVITGNLQSLRKYVEHMGLTSSETAGLTRSIHSPTFFGRALSISLLHEPYHGVHHRYGGLRHAALPKFVAVLPEAESQQRLLFSGYVSACWDMLRSLNNPRIGPQWRSEETRTV